MAKIDNYKVIPTSKPLDISKPVIGIDRDGVINRDLGTYVTRPQDFEPIPGSLEAIADLRRKGHSIVIITNQGGIEKGIMTSNDVDNVHSYMLELLGQAGCSSIDGIYYSESSNKKDYYAKPNIGMFKKCEEDNKNIKFKNGFYIGDKISDLKAAVKIGSTPILVRTGYGKETEKELERYTHRDLKKKTKIYDSLSEFVNLTL
jgi:D-glycero-D-manno-heptose 1,7-bisphosphate phosphatase